MKTKWILLPLLLFLVSLVMAPAAWSAESGADSAVIAKATVRTVADEAAADESACDAKPCIIYRQRRCCRKVCCGCDPPQKTSLKVADPCCCKSSYDIPICLPACCKGDPCVTSRCGICCKGVVVYKWCCGYKVKIVIKKCGDIVVISYRC
jgi:hypothetical protein